MKLLGQSKDPQHHEVRIELDPAESRALRASLAEVSFGFHPKNFQVRTDMTKDQVRALFDKFDNFDLEKNNGITLSLDDLLIVKEAHEATLRELGPDEYSTRTGVEFGDGQQTLNQLMNLLPERF